MAEENVLLRFEGEDAGASSVVEHLVALMQGGVVAIDEFIAAGYKIGDIRAALDQIAGGAASAGQGMADLGLSTAEADRALGAANNILGTTATMVDELGRASLTGAEELANFNRVTAEMAAEQDVALRSMDLMTASLAAMDAIMIGTGGDFNKLDGEIAIYDEMMAGANDRTAAYTATIGVATTETSAFVQEQLSLAERMGAGSDIINALTDRLTQLAIAEGIATPIAQQLATATEQVTVAQENLARITPEELDALKLMSETLQELVPKLVEGAIGFDTLAKAGLSESAVLTEVARLTLLGATDLDAMAAAGINVQTVMAVVDATMTGFAERVTLAGASTKALADGMVLMNDAAQTAANALAQDAIRMVEAADAARLLAEAKAQAAAAALQMAQAEEMDAGTIGALALKADEAALAVGKLAGAQDASKASTYGMNDAMGISQFLLFTLGMMALSTGRQFLDMGMKFDDTMTIIQGKTQATDAQMQSWTSTLQDMAVKGGYTLDVLAQGLDLVTSAGFQADSATMVLEQGMQLARASGQGLTESTNLLATSLNAYKQSSASAADYAQILFVALANGKQDVQQLTQMLGSTIDTAAAAGISFQDLVNAETLFSKASTDSSMAARNFQTFIAAMGADTSMTAAQVAKLSDTFNAAKFATLDWAGKLEMLASVSGNDAAAFAKLIGGTGAATNAMDMLGISTNRLASNAHALGLSFDPVLYNSLSSDAARLLYLTEVTGGNETRLKSLLSGGVHPLNDGLALLDLTTSDVVAQFAKLHPAFDQAKFDSLGLKDQLLMLWNATNHNVTEFASFIGGTKNLGVAANLMGVDLTSGPAPKGMEHFRGVTRDGEASLRTFQGTADTTSNKTLPKLSSAYDKASSDMKASTDKMNAAFSNLAHTLTQTLASSGLTDFLNNLAQAINTVATKTAFLQGVFLFLGGPTMLLIGLINNLGGVFTGLGALVDRTAGHFNSLMGTFNKLGTTASKAMNDMWNSIKVAFTSGTDSVQRQVQSFIDGIIAKFLHLKSTVIGGSIVPDMISAITAAFQGASGPWSSAIQSALDTIQSLFDTAKSTLTSIAQNTVTGIQSAWNALPGIASSIFNNVRSVILGILNGMLGSVFSAGLSIANSVANGIRSGIGAAVSAAQSLAAAVASYLPHSPAEVGPLSHLNEFMPGMIDTLVHGMLDGTSKLQAASSQLARSAGSGFTSTTSQLSPLGSSSVVGLLGQINATLQQQGRMPTLGGQPTNIGAGSVTQNIAAVNLNGMGVQNLQALQAQLNQLAGLSYERALRGAING